MIDGVQHGVGNSTTRSGEHNNSNITTTKNSCEATSFQKGKFFKNNNIIIIFITSVL